MFPDYPCLRITGWTARLIDHEGYLVEIVQEAGEGGVQVSRQFVLRMAFECGALAWVAEHQYQQINSLVEMLTAPDRVEGIDPAYARLREDLLSSGEVTAAEALAGVDGPSLWPLQGPRLKDLREAGCVIAT